MSRVLVFDEALASSFRRIQSCGTRDFDILWTPAFAGVTV
jgi:hypothetical protein